MIGHVIHRAEDGTETDVTEALQALYDLAVGSSGWGSGFWSAEDAEPVALMARTCGFEEVDEITKYIQDRREHEERDAFLRQHYSEIFPDGPTDVVLRKRTANALSGHEHVYSSALGKCMWPGCKAKDSQVTA